MKNNEETLSNNTVLKSDSFEHICEHVPYEDDGDCTTAVRCSVCGDVVTHAKSNHTTPETWNCTVGYTCADCGKTVAAVATHTVPEGADCTQGYTL